MTFRSIFFCITSALALASPARAADRPAPESTEHFINSGYEFPLATCQLPATCGGRTPRTRENWRGETGNDNLIDRYALAFEGLEVKFLYLLGNSSDPQSAARIRTDANRPVILQVKVTGDRWPLPLGLRIGASRSRVEAILGVPQDAAATCASYASTDTQNEAVLCYAQDRLASVEWTQWWDG